MKNLPINLDTFGFVEREKNNSGKYILNRCGRDFLYYALHYFFPEKYNHLVNNPQYIQKHNIFGLSVHPWFAWTLLQFIYVPKLLTKQNLKLFINDEPIDSFLDFYRVLLKPSKLLLPKEYKKLNLWLIKVLFLELIYLWDWVGLWIMSCLCMVMINIIYLFLILQN